MTKTEAVVASIVAFAVSLVLLGITGATLVNAQNGKEKDKQQFSQCVAGGGSYIKTDRGPMCLK